jgi:hypothetical protein
LLLWSQTRFRRRKNQFIKIRQVQNALIYIFNTKSLGQILKFNLFKKEQQKESSQLFLFNMASIWFKKPVHVQTYCKHVTLKPWASEKKNSRKSENIFGKNIFYQIPKMNHNCWNSNIMRLCYCLSNNKTNVVL